MAMDECSTGAEVCLESDHLPLKTYYSFPACECFYQSLREALKKNHRFRDIVRISETPLFCFFRWF